MFAWWGTAVVRLRWAVLAAGLVLAAVGVVWGTGVFGVLTGGGYDDPTSESSRAHGTITSTFREQDVDLVVLYSSTTATVEDPAFRDAVTRTVAEIRAQPEVASVTDWYATQAPNLIAKNRNATYAAIQLKATDEDGLTAAYERIEPVLDAPGLRTDIGGNVGFMRQANEQSTRDVARAEILSMPVLLVLLVLIFGGLVAAGTPLLIGGLAIVGAFVAVRLITLVTDVSVFAINIITLIGLGMAIDYSLFVVSRFREELAAGRDVPDAVGRTVATAGRTVMVSGLTIALALASLLIFPQAFLRSMGLGGMAAVLVAMLAALTVLPALLAVLGHRVDALRIPLPWRRRSAAGRSPALPADNGAWARVAHSVMRRPALYAIGVVALLAVFAAPFLRVEFGGTDERVLPADAGARVVAERIRAEFPGGSVAPIQVVLSTIAPDSGGTLSPGVAQEFAATVQRVPGVTAATVAGDQGSAALISVTYPGQPTDDSARALVSTIRDLPTPPGTEVLVGGRPAGDLDLLASLKQRLPWMALIMASATLVLLFLAFGSVVLPIKAVLMNLASIGASFGVVVWIFQDGHLADLLNFTATGFIEPTNPILMLAVLFGLATDYEVFLLSRVREEWDRTGDNTTAVAAGLQHTGRIITAAALLLIVVVAGFATGGVSIVKLVGIGMIVAIVVDATLVRALLVPATMRLLGRWNWWSPRPLAGFYRRFGIREAPVETVVETREVTPVG